MEILILNGPNLNLQGRRDPEVYGTQTFDGLLQSLRERYPQAGIDYRQSNVEGELVDALQQAEGRYDGVVLNAGGYTHTSVALRDAAYEVDQVEVVDPGDVSLLAPVAVGSIMGFGLESYRLGVEALLGRTENQATKKQKK